MSDTEAGWRIVRQDDNGNRFLVEAGLSEKAARRRVDELTARGHKQTYWIEPDRRAPRGRAAPSP